MSSFDLAAPDFEFTPEKHEYESPPRYTEQQVTSQFTEEEIQAEANRRTGDVAIYQYYAGSVGWIPTIIFMVSCTIFIFGISFPCKFGPSTYDVAILTIPSQLSGSKCGRNTTKSTRTSVLASISAYILCLVLFRSRSLVSAAGKYPETMVSYY